VDRHTYCVAPIVRGASNISKASFFAAGVDCCDCPVRTWRCGDWEDPFAAAGLRQVDNGNLAFFRFAAEKWGAQYDSSVDHALFFHFSRDPAKLQESYLKRLAYIFVLSLVVVMVLSCLGAFALEFAATHWTLAGDEGDVPKVIPRYV
jgi:hypothetical protein